MSDSYRQAIMAARRRRTQQRQDNENKIFEKSRKERENREAQRINNQRNREILEENTNVPKSGGKRKTRRVKAQKTKRKQSRKKTNTKRKHRKRKVQKTKRKQYSGGMRTKTHIKQPLWNERTRGTRLSHLDNL